MTELFLIPRIFRLLPKDILLVIYDYDPTRRERLMHLCNVLRLHVPAWFRTRCSLFWLRRYTVPETRATMDAKTLSVWYVRIASLCHCCRQLKSSATILRHLREETDSHNCENCAHLELSDVDDY